MNHSFDLDIAKEYGIEEAIILNHLYFWLKKNEGNDTNYHDGRYWTYNSAKSFNGYFYYMTERKIRLALKHLEDEGLIVVGNYNKTPYDRTRWYSLTDKGKSIIMRETVETVDVTKCNIDVTECNMEVTNGKMDVTKCQMDFTESQNGNVNSVTPIPDNNTDDNKPYAIQDKKPYKRTVKTVLEEMPTELQQPLQDFLDMRKSIKKPMTPKALELMLTKLNELSNGDMKTAIEILNQSIVNSWQSVYPLKEEKKRKSSNPYADMLGGYNDGI